MQIDLDAGEILEDGSDEELAAWVQLSRATSGRMDALRTPRRDLPLLGAGDAHSRQDKLEIIKDEGILHEVEDFPAAYRRGFHAVAPDRSRYAL